MYLSIKKILLFMLLCTPILSANPSNNRYYRTTNFEFYAEEATDPDSGIRSRIFIVPKITLLTRGISFSDMNDGSLIDLNSLPANPGAKSYSAWIPFSLYGAQLSEYDKAEILNQIFSYSPYQYVLPVNNLGSIQFNVLPENGKTYSPEDIKAKQKYLDEQKYLANYHRIGRFYSFENLKLSDLNLIFETSTDTQSKTSKIFKGLVSSSSSIGIRVDSLSLRDVNFINRGEFMITATTSVELTNVEKASLQIDMKKMRSAVGNYLFQKSSRSRSHISRSFFVFKKVSTSISTIINEQSSNSSTSTNDNTISFVSVDSDLSPEDLKDVMDNLFTSEPSTYKELIKSHEAAVLAAANDPEAKDLHTKYIAYLHDQMKNTNSDKPFDDLVNTFDKMGKDGKKASLALKFLKAGFASSRNGTSNNIQVRKIHSEDHFASDLRSIVLDKKKTISKNMTISSVDFDDLSKISKKVEIRDYKRYLTDDNFKKVFKHTPRGKELEEFLQK